MTRRSVTDSAATWRLLGASGALDGLDLAAEGGIELLRAQASTRAFYRVSAPRDSTTRVLVQYPDEPGVDAEVERYVRTAAWFRAAGVRVPRVLARGRCALLVEDLGDRLIGDIDRAGCDRYYRQAITTIERVQRYASRNAAANPGSALDGPRLTFELEYFDRYAASAWLQVENAGRQRAAVYGRLVDACGRIPQTQCHRDYHARNLLALDDRLAVIDFQDVMRGPIFYDAASLLHDNYCEVPVPIQRACLAQLWAAIGRPIGEQADFAIPTAPIGLPPAARQAYCLVVLQRSLKALGTFGFQITQRGAVEYSAFAPRTWEHVTWALDQLAWRDASEAFAPLQSRILA